MKFRSGALIGNLSGSLGSVTASHNRYGSHFRPRTIPINPDTQYQQTVKGNFGVVSGGWTALAAANRAQWATFAANNPVVDNLGQSQNLSANAAYVMLNLRLKQCGVALITAPPVGAAPAGLTSLTLEADIGAGDVQVTYTATPLAANDKLVIRATVVDTASINFVKNKYKLVAYSATAQASPFEFKDEIEERFGSLIVGQYVHVLVAVMSAVTGLISAPMSDSVIVTTTP